MLTWWFFPLGMFRSFCVSYWLYNYFTTQTPLFLFGCLFDALKVEDDVPQVRPIARTMIPSNLYCITDLRPKQKKTQGRVLGWQ